MSFPSGADVGPDELDLEDERPQRGRRGPFPFTFDIETVPQRRFWPAPEPEPGETGERSLFEPPSEYVVDEFWMRREFENMDMARRVVQGDQDNWLDGFRQHVNDQVRQCAAPLQATGQLPGCHPTTAHIVSVSFGRVKPGSDVDVDVTTTQIDDFLEERAETAPPDTPDGETVKADYEIMSKPGLDELDDSEIVRAERKVLARTVQLLEWGARQQLTFVSFNGKGFDFPMIRWRCMVIGVRPPQLNWYEMLYPYRHKEHIDLRLLMSDGNRHAKGTLAMWAEAMGLEAEESGAQVLDWARRGEWGEIRRYGGVEMETLIRMFLRCLEVL